MLGAVLGMLLGEVLGAVLGAVLGMLLGVALGAVLNLRKLVTEPGLKNCSIFPPWGKKFHPGTGSGFKTKTGVYFSYLMFPILNFPILDSAVPWDINPVILHPQLGADSKLCLPRMQPKIHSVAFK